MIVCQCRAVSDRQVRGAVAEGCVTLRAVAAVTGAGTSCGTCVPSIRDLVCGSCPSRAVALGCDDRVDVAAAQASPLVPVLEEALLEEALLAESGAAPVPAASVSASLTG